MTYKNIYICIFAFLSLTTCQSINDDQDMSKPVKSWVRDTAVALKTVEPGTDYQDLAAFGKMVGDARMVALGEPSHGNREVFQLKHRMLEYLVHEKGFNIFAIEAAFAETQDWNDYVLHGRGSAEEALASITYWAWDTEEVAAMLDWMRQFNANPAHETKLKVYGFDIQNPERAVRLILSYLNKTDPAFAQRMQTALGSLTVPFSDPDEWGWRPLTAHEVDSSALQDAREILSRLEDRKADYISKSDLAEWDIVRQYARQIVWWIEANINDGENYEAMSDQAMSENLKWIMGREGSEAKAVLWAHNSHLADATIKRWGDVDVLGRLLRRHYGEEIRLVGFLFDRGGMTALDAVPGGSLKTFDFGPAETNYFETVLVEAGQDLSLLDLSEIPDTGPVKNYFSARRYTRHSGGGYNPARADRYFMDYLLPEAFDVLAFVKETMPTRTINRRDYDSVDILPQPENLDFEHSGIGSPPSAWVSWSKAERWGYTNTVVDTTAAVGQQSARLCRADGHMSPDVSGSLVQHVEASSYHGKRIALSAKAKIAPSMPNTISFLRLKIRPLADGAVHEFSADLSDSLDAHRINATDWATYEIEADVPDNAGSIQFGLFQVGVGCTWLDDVELKLVSK